MKRREPGGTWREVAFVLPHAIDDRETQRRVIALAAAIVVTCGFLVSLDRLMSESSSWSLPRPSYIEARLIDRTIPAEPVVLLKSMPESRATSPLAKRQPDRRSVETPAIVPVEPMRQPSLELFTRDGAVQLPSDPRLHAPANKNAIVLSHKDLVPMAPERFAWARPDGETLGGAMLRKIYNHEWKLPWGTVVTCVKGPPMRGMPFVIDCRPGTPTATSDELRAVRADPPVKPDKAQAKTSLARRHHGGSRAAFASLRD